MENTNLNVQELLNQAYDKYANAAIAKRYNTITMKDSGLKFRIYEGNKIANETFAWKLEFNKTIDFGYGNWRVFYFNSDRALGRFLFETDCNGGVPKGGKICVGFKEHKL